MRAPFFLPIVAITILVTMTGCGRDGAHREAAPGKNLENAEAIGFDKVLPVFLSRCSQCHSAGSAHGNWLDPNTAVAKREMIYHRIWVSRDMPPTGRITEGEREIIAAWARGSSTKTLRTDTSTSGGGENADSRAVSTIDPRVGTGAWRGFDPITRGAYLARVANCFSCHTSLTPGSPVGAGGRRIETPFGSLYTPNITPDFETGIGGWTQGEFYQALHNGIRNDGALLYPAFPYTSYTKIVRSDVDDLYAYLMSLRPQKNKVDVNHLRFPFNIRASLRVWRALYFKPGEFEPDPTENLMWNRGKYLVTGPGHCGECHTPRNFMGALEQGKEFMGSEVDNWFASNMRYSVRNGIAQWSQADLVNFLGTGSAAGKATVVGPMAEVVFNSLQFLTRDDLRAMAFFLSVISSPGYYNEKELKTEFSVEHGENLYIENCAQCHKLSGLGVLGEYPPFFQNPVVNQDDSSNLIAVILLGVPPQGSYGTMPSFSQKLNDADIASIANYIRVRWGSANECEISTADVAKRREALTPNQ